MEELFTTISTLEDFKKCGVITHLRILRYDNKDIPKFLIECARFIAYNKENLIELALDVDFTNFEGFILKIHQLIPNVKVHLWDRLVSGINSRERIRAIATACRCFENIGTFVISGQDETMFLELITKKRDTLSNLYLEVDKLRDVVLRYLIETPILVKLRRLEICGWNTHIASFIKRLLNLEHLCLYDVNASGCALGDALTQLPRLCSFGLVNSNSDMIASIAPKLRNLVSLRLDMDVSFQNLSAILLTNKNLRELELSTIKKPTQPIDSARLARIINKNSPQLKRLIMDSTNEVKFLKSLDRDTLYDLFDKHPSMANTSVGSALNKINDELEERVLRMWCTRTL